MGTRLRVICGRNKIIMKTLKFTLSIFIIFAVFSCGKITEKVEQRVNDKIDRTIDNTLNKLDSNLSFEKLDSIKNSLDSSLKKLDKKIKDADRKIKEKSNN